jgi:hypothetical protein
MCLDAGRIVATGATSEVVGGYLARAATPDAEDGFAFLADRPRPDTIGHPDDIRLEWVRTTDGEGHQRASFAEREPIVVEFGFTLVGDTASLEFGLGVGSLRQGVELFVVSSPTYGPAVAAGTYVLGMRIDPNYLKAGRYSLGLKAFANGARADTLHDALRFAVVDGTPARRPAGHYRKWGGHLKFDYTWGEIARRQAGAVYPS